MGYLERRVSGRRVGSSFNLPYVWWRLDIRYAETCWANRSPQQITDRLDAFIDELRKRFHAHAIGKPKGSVKEPYDVLVVAHGHILRAFAGRWIAKNIAENPSLILEAGGVGTLSYEHHKLNEPAILLGGAFMSDLVENAEVEKEKELT